MDVGSKCAPEEETCPRCGSSDIGKVRGSLVCNDCGAVIEEPTVSSEEEPHFSYEDMVDESRHSYDRSLGPSTRTERRNFSIAVSIVSELQNELHLPQFVKNDVIERYKEYAQAESVRKDKISPVVGALVWIVGRKSSIPIPLESIAEASNTDQSDIVGWYQEVVPTLKINVPQISLEGLTIQFAKKVGLSPEAIGRATTIAKKLKGQVGLVVGKDPKSVAGAAVYLAAEEKDEDATQNGIAETASISKVTLRTRVEAVSKAAVV